MKAVATSTERKRTEKYLTLAGIRERFDAIVCGDEVERGKPEPDIFLEAARRTGKDLKSVLCWRTLRTA